GVGEGTATITLTIDGVSDTITITVVPATTGGGGGSELPVNPGPFTPITNTDPMLGDGFFFQMNFKDLSDLKNNVDIHKGAVHLEDIIKDGNYAGVTATAVNPKYAPYITIGNCEVHSGKPAILFNYHPTLDEWLDWITTTGNNELTIPVQVELSRGGKSAITSINMIFPGCQIKY
ncbi:MAG: hypothetical protein FWG42_01305, partial [Clostridiales bacterium]|nr:hypothetical protein [Clostridiales bacterium]